MGLLDKVFGRNKDVEHGFAPKQDDAAEVPKDDVLTQPEAPAGVAEIAAEPEPEVGATYGSLEGMASAEPERAAVAEGAPAVAAPELMGEARAEAGSDAIRAFDQFGREVMVPREQWRTEVLPGMLQETWSDPDQLYGLILNSLNDGFLGEVAGAAEHLYRTDTLPVRGTSLWAAVLLQQKRTGEAEAVLNGYTQQHGEDGAILTNLAKVYADQGDLDRRDATLWHALELEPNLENGLGWYASLAAERGGDAAAEEALERVRLTGGSWRAQLWLARAAMAKEDMAGAMTLYREALGRVARPVPGDFLMQMSGDLGARGQLRELLELTAPEFQPELHGLPVGNNLIKAFLDTGDVANARVVKDALFAMNRPEWGQALAYWDTEIARRTTDSGNAGLGQEQQVQVGMLRVDGPIWLPSHSAAVGEFAAKPADGVTVVFLGGTAEPAQPPAQVELQMTDLLGRLSRALPLFLAEQVSLRTAANGRTMLPWAVGNGTTQPSGFVVSGQVWPDAMAQQTVADPAHRPDYVVTVHIDAETEPWLAELAFVRAEDGVRVGEMEARFAPTDPEAGLRKLADEVVELLGAAAAEVDQPRYQVPSGPLFGNYLQRLEQLLAVRCAAMDGVSPTFLSGEHAILDGDLQLALDASGSLPARLLLRETVAAMKVVRPEIAAGYEARVGRLEAERPM